MAISTYAELLENVPLHVDRTDLGDLLPSFLELTEERINRVLRVLGMIVRSQETANAQFIDLPADFIELKNIQLNTTIARPLFYASMQQMDTIRALHPEGGEPTHYTISGGQLELAPVPAEDSETVIEMTYYAKVAALSVDVPTNWLITKAPSVYLWGMCYEASQYIDDAQMAAKYETRFNTAINELQAESDRAESSGSPLIRVRNPIRVS